MDDFLTPLQTVKKVQNNIEKFESLSVKDTHASISKPKKLQKSILEIEDNVLEKPVLTLSRPANNAESLLDQPLRGADVKEHNYHKSTAFLEKSYLKEFAPSSLSDNAREILKSQPSHEDLVAVLQYLQFGIEGRHGFNVKLTNPKSAQIINILVTVTVPAVWASVRQTELSEDEARIKVALVSSLSCLAGLGALLTQIKQLTPHNNEDVLFDTIMVLGEVLKGHRAVSGFLQDSQKLYEQDSARRLFWQEMTAVVAGSRILSTVSQALTVNRPMAEKLQKYMWLGNATNYTKWLASSIVHAAIELAATEVESWKALSQLVRRGLNLGNRGVFVAEIYTKLLLGQRALWTPLHLILQNLAPYEQRVFFDSMLLDLAQNYLASSMAPTAGSSHDPDTQRIVAGAAALIAGVVKANETLEEYLEQWLCNDGSSSTVLSLLSRRALIAAMGHSQDKLERVLEKSLSNFGDKLQIQHASILHQEAMAQTILLTIGHINRNNITSLKRSSISTLVMHAVSNRLAASIPRTRLLGMIVGTAFSRLVDKRENLIDFGVQEMESEDVRAWLGLVHVNDKVGDNIFLHRLAPESMRFNGAPANRATVARKKTRLLPQTSKVIAIEEISDTMDSEDDDLRPYQKPDSDPDDSDEDPTLINRSKPSAPVYIIDLIRQLQTTDKHDVISLALKTAPSLIRRKAGFGTELSDNIQALVTTLTNLQQSISEPDEEEWRLQALIACVVAQPSLIGPSLAELYFHGDFSISQRITILTAIGLASRDIAGFKDDPSVQKTDDFPSKRLPQHLEPTSQPQITATRNPIAMLTDTEAHKTIRPMALAAADQVTGPSALKVRTFSSRMDVEKKNKEKTAARTKLIPKDLHRVLTDSIYLPLCSRMSLLLSHTLNGRLPNTTILHTSTVRLFLQTLTLVLHTLGPLAGPQLPTLTHETLLLLLGLHNVASLAGDPAVLPVLLHLLLALLDITIEAGVTAQERLITDFGVQMTELVNWSNGLGDRVSLHDAEGSEGGVSWNILAAGIQVKWFEIGKRFQSRMLGLTMDEMDRLADS